jgi:hypothetical protein
VSSSPCRHACEKFPLSPQNLKTPYLKTGEGKGSCTQPVCLTYKIPGMVPAGHDDLRRLPPRTTTRERFGRQDAESRSIYRQPHGLRTIRSSSERRASERPPWSRGSRPSIAQGDVPEPLKKVPVRTLDLALLQAGQGDAANLLKTGARPWRTTHDRSHNVVRV